MSDLIPSLHCLFSYDNRLGGSVHAALNVCKYLAAEGQPVEMVAPYSTTDDVDYLQDSYPELTCHRVARSFPARYCNSRELGAWLEKNLPRFKVVEIHGIWVLATWQAAQTCLKLGVPYIIRPHGSLDPFDLQKRALLKKCLGPIYVRWLLRNAAGIVCTANLEAERLVTYGANPIRHAMPLPVPLPVTSGNGHAFRKTHGIPADAFVVIFLSRVDYKKGLNFLIPALGRLKSEYPRLWFVMAGTGTSEFGIQVQRWLAENNVAGFTSQVGFISGQDKLDAFAAADIFALPSLNENFGIVNIEAMHAGLPLLISDEVYISQEIAESGAGVICKTSVDSVVEKLREMLNGSIDLKAMGERGRALVQRRYRPEAATKALIDLYSQVGMEQDPKASGDIP